MDFFELVKTGTPRDVQTAISNGAEVNARDKDGKTALMGAAEYNQYPEGSLRSLLRARMQGRKTVQAKWLLRKNACSSERHRRL